MKDHGRNHVLKVEGPRPLLYFSARLVATTLKELFDTVESRDILSFIIVRDKLFICTAL